MKYILVFGFRIALFCIIGILLLPKTNLFFSKTENSTPTEADIAALNAELNTTLGSVQTKPETLTATEEISMAKTESATRTSVTSESLPKKSIVAQSGKVSEKPAVSNVAPVKKYIEIVKPSGFVNTNDLPVTLGEYIGKKVILLNVITYTCSNCQATFPYVNAWYDKYKDDGLIVIGLHTPEFAFEKDKKNVEDAMLKFGISYPVVMDNDYATWTAYGNRFWPRKYLIDIHGNIIYDHIGEGAYEETEAEILKALIERKKFLGL